MIICCIFWLIVLILTNKCKPKNNPGTPSFLVIAKKEPSYLKKPSPVVERILNFNGQFCLKTGILENIVLNLPWNLQMFFVPSRWDNALLWPWWGPEPQTQSSYAPLVESPLLIHALPVHCQLFLSGKSLGQKWYSCWIILSQSCCRRSSTSDKPRTSASGCCCCWSQYWSRPEYECVHMQKSLVWIFHPWDRKRKHSCIFGPDKSISVCSMK